MKKILLPILFLLIISCSEKSNYIENFIKTFNQNRINRKELFSSEDIYNSFIGVDELIYRKALSDESAIVSDKASVGDILYKINFADKNITSFMRFIPEYKIIELSNTHLQVVFEDNYYNQYFNHIVFKVNLVLLDGKNIYFGIFGQKIADDKVFDFDIKKMSEKLRDKVKKIELSEIDYVFYSEIDKSIDIDVYVR